MEALSKSWVLRRNCALSPRQLAVAFCLIGATSMLIAVAWAATGAWIVLPFAAIELLVLAVAFLAYSRHARDQERITLAQDCVQVEVLLGESLRRVELPRAWLRCRMEESPKGMVRLDSLSGGIEIGRFVSPADRKLFFEEFRLALAV
ncbi:MAG: DUF2244 domain-containing protein [Betaproteobacteria bacterium]